MAKFGAVYMPPGSQRLLASGLNVTMLQANVSSAFDVRGQGFELSRNVMAQVGECLYPNYGPKSDSTDFQSSVTIYLMNSREGLIRNNTILWRCSAFDMDVSDRVVTSQR